MISVKNQKARVEFTRRHLLWNLQYSQKCSGGYVMVWGCFSHDCSGPIHRVEGIMDGYGYKNIIKDVMLAHGKKKMFYEWIFQKDNGPKHTSKVVKNFFQ